jgi:DNA primase
MYCYPDGSTFCFSCRKGNRTTKFVPKIEEASEEDAVVLPPECSQDFDKRAIAWVSKASLTVEDMIKHGLLWNEAKQQLIFPFYDENAKILAWQARNFSPNAKAKVFTKGDIKKLFPIYHGANDLVLVEDCLSAIKVNKHTQLSSMPLLGSGISKAKLPYLTKKYEHIYVWLDSNMLSSAQNIATQIRMLGGSSSVVFTEKDPKYCDVLDILS